MTVIALALLFATAGLVSLAVLAQAYARGFAAFTTLRCALANCEDVVVARLRVIEHRPARLRLVNSAKAGSAAVSLAERQPPVQRLDELLAAA
ncbi:hypothetical protein SZ64_03190 [Erythrobacter sp. SG61-1L]|uniref:hypothetical protein n=1 Tax=Erythrobacter sp. SG61-1L TaxID=1603897 RepID=UPI0006C90A76|nr:hypothetical protein [Erythrobacter sp. SG61-1L]KPL67185.1 hypothetical protein SZ64_03190 [Erythrobacter sp. SG61-1L]